MVNTIVIPDLRGVVYTINGVVQSPGPVTITEDTVVKAVPAEGYTFPDGVDTEWFFTYTE